MEGFEADVLYPIWNSEDCKTWLHIPYVGCHTSVPPVLHLLFKDLQLHRQMHVGKHPYKIIIYSATRKIFCISKTYYTIVLISTKLCLFHNFISLCSNTMVFVNHTIKFKYPFTVIVHFHLYIMMGNLLCCILYSAFIEMCNWCLLW